MMLSPCLGSLISFLFICRMCLRPFHPLSGPLIWILALDSGAPWPHYLHLCLIWVISLNQLSLWEFGTSPLTDPLMSMFLLELVLKWVVILLITPHMCILHFPFWFLQNLFPWRVHIYPLAFHTGRNSFMFQDTLFMKPLHMGETYFLTWIIPIIHSSLHRIQWWFSYKTLWIN